MKPRQRRLARARLDVVRALKRPQMVTVTYSIEDDEEITSENSLKLSVASRDIPGNLISF